jgi:hypothetical protein
MPLGIRTDQPRSVGTNALERIYVTTAGGALQRVGPA